MDKLALKAVDKVVTMVLKVATSLLLVDRIELDKVVVKKGTEEL